MEREEILSRIFSFLDKIGIETEEGPVTGKVFVPGITIKDGRLYYERDAVKYPGDLLHEAGHIAVTEPSLRLSLNGEIPQDRHGEEMAVLVWSYLAAKESGIPPGIVFHPDGYKGQSDWLLENFENKVYIGLPLIVWMKMVEQQKDGTVKVIRWLREGN
jgi:hypothetical protein